MAREAQNLVAVGGDPPAYRGGDQEMTHDLTVYLYVVGPSVGPVKIGRSMCPPKRLKQLEGKTGMKLHLTGQWPIGQAIALGAERYAHHLLRDKHVAGEWFDVSAAEASAAVAIAVATDHVANYAMPALEDASRIDGVYARTKFPRDMYDRLNRVSGGHHASFIRDAVERELERRERNQ